MTRLLHVISGLGTGGAESFLATLLPQLAARGYEQRVVSLTGRGRLADAIEAAGTPVVALDVRGPARAPLEIRRIAHLVAAFEPAIVQGWMYHGDLFAALALRLAGRRPRPRLVWNIRCSDMRLADYSLQLRLTVRACAALSRWPDVVLANSAAGLKAHEAAGYRPRVSAIVPNGVDAARFRPDPQARAEVRAELGLDPMTPVVVHVARVDPMKDHATMLAAAARLTGAETLLVGAGTEGLALPPGMRALGRRTDVERVLAAGDVIVSSSAYGEGFSNAIAEGMAAGLVPVATDVGDSRMIVGATGAIVPPGSPQALAEALEGVVGLPAAARTARGLEARARIVEAFSIAGAADRFDQLYGSIVASPAGSPAGTGRRLARHTGEA